MISPQCGQITSKELVINAKVFRKQARPAQEDFVVTGRSAPSQVCRINRVFVADSERMSFLRNPVHETKSWLIRAASFLISISTRFQGQDKEQCYIVVC